MKFSFYLIPVLALAAVSCGKFKPWEPPPKPCSDPLKCISIKSVNDSKCQFPFNWNNGNLIQARNSHPKDVVILTYRERVRHINQLLPDESIVKTVRVSTGTPEPLGCEVTGSEQEAFDIWSYSKIAACFESGSCVISKPTPGPKPTETRTQTCERECATNGKFCVTAKLDTTKPDEKETLQRYLLTSFAAGVGGSSNVNRHSRNH
ncbi:hypothetical protein N8E89_09430 [Phyllobacterium sp. A18/5-2]|uniref:hypothetical protein n=1 Tax=Phyllobacterium sp. A18/5-2 TaxID=2978392 RepID=UPI0021C684ED|nr:hypothetical protein [Phyllobacterium sp. A18/5-2]UXN62936.1 hypothetical protein N8E89_09430 [Phyllobacterium sp. A18/5-2]